MNNKEFVEIKRKIIGNRTYVTVYNYVDKQAPQYDFITELEYKNRYLSDENLSYFISFSKNVKNEEETDEDQYLLYHALQEDKKLCVSFRTHNSKKIYDVFSGDKYVCSQPHNVKDDIRKDITIVRTGTLSDYYDINEIVRWYADNCKVCFDKDLVVDMASKKLSEIAFGDYKYRGVTYKYVIDFKGDDVLFTYGPAALIISGILLGYPLESTKSLIESISDIFCVRKDKKIYPNELCPCGSGKKYKKCCGK